MMLRVVSALIGLTSLAGAGLMTLPVAWQSMSLLSASDDPAALSNLRLEPALTAERIAREADTALAAGDADLADSFLALADSRGIPVDPARLAAVATALDGSFLDSAYAFGRGAVVGDVDGVTGLAGAFAGDMVGIGDVRDLTREGWKAARGEEPDKLVVGLAAVGLAVTAATWASAGEVAPLRGGLSLIKKARKAGRLSKELTASIGRILAKAVDGTEIRRAIDAAASLDLGLAAKTAARAIRPAEAAPLAAVGRDTYALLRRTGTRSVEDVFAVARSPAEIGKAAKLSERLGRATRATLKLLGRGALVLGAGAWTLLCWLVAGLVYAYVLARSAQGFGERMGRRLRRRRHPPRLAPQAA